MSLRLAASTCLLLMITGLLSWLALHTPLEIQTAQLMSGERWYRLTLNDEHIGYLHSAILPTHNGGWQIDSELRFALAKDEPITIADRLVFAGTQPWDLQSATYDHRRRQQQETVRIEQHQQYLVAQLSREGAVTQKNLDWTFTLADYLAFETWLWRESPSAGSKKQTTSVDLTKLELVRKEFTLIDATADAIRVKSSATLGATEITLDRNFVPRSMTMAGLFKLTRSTKDQALAEPNTLHAASYFVALNGPIDNHTQAQRLVLDVRGNNNSVWQSPLILQANPITSKNPPDTANSYLLETLEYPVGHPSIEAISKRFESDEFDNDSMQTKIANLVDYVHNYIDYDLSAEPKSVIGSLQNPTGSCLEFANLFTTLARQLNIPTKTIVGLAYGEQPTPAFRFHAWNEIFVNDRWQAVDPTWNQIKVDATHLPLPPSEAAALALITGSVEVEFSVESVTYFP